MNTSNLPIIKSLVFFLALYSQQFVAEQNQKELQRIGQTAKRKPQAGELKVVKVEGEANFEIGDNSNLISQGVVILPGSRITSKRGARVFVKNPSIGVFCIMENSSLSFGKIIATKDTPEPARKLDIDLRNGSILGILNGSINQSIISCEISYPSGIVVVESLDFGSTFYLNANENIRIITSNEDNNPFEFLDKDISAVNQAYENLKPFQHKFPQNKNKLISAILSNDFEMAATLIENGEDINKATADGITPLMIGAYENRTEFVNYMLSMGGDPNVSDLRGFTPLHVACEYGNNQIAKSLIDRGADINALDEEGWTPLLQAVDKQNAATVHLLTQKGANVNIGLTDGHSPLHAACEQGAWEIAKILIEAGADVNKERNDGLTPLIFATWSDNEETVSFLLKNGANPNVSDEHGFSPLHHAAHHDNTTNINLLLNSGAEIDARTKENDTPLWVAAWNGNHKSTDLLIEKGADVNAIGITGLTILSQNIEIRQDPNHWHEKQWRLIERSLRENGAKAKVNGFGGTTLPNLSEFEKALLDGDLDAVSTCINNGVDLSLSNEFGYSPVGIAVKSKNLELLELLVGAGAPIDSEDIPPLLIAAEQLDQKAINYLIEHGADCNSQDSSGNTALHLASGSNKLHFISRFDDTWAYTVDASVLSDVVEQRGYNELLKTHNNDQTQIIELLLKNGADVNIANKSGYEAIHLPGISANPKAMSSILKAGIDVNSTTISGWTPLHIAANSPKPSTDTFKVLINYGANVASAGNLGETPLHIASANEIPSTDAIKVLIASGANADSKDNNGRTPLHTALEIHTPSIEVISTLLESGASINSKDSVGMTPLHVALENTTQSIEIINFLIDSGADINAASYEGWTPLQEAVLSNNFEAVRLLVENSCQINAINQHQQNALFLAIFKNYPQIVDFLESYGAVVNGDPTVSPPKSIHVKVDGNGFMGVFSTNDGPLFCRELVLTLNGEGGLFTSEGYRLFFDIQFPNKAVDFEIDNGIINAKMIGGNIVKNVGHIDVFTFENPEKLQVFNKVYYKANQASGEAIAHSPEETRKPNLPVDYGQIIAIELQP